MNKGAPTWLNWQEVFTTLAILIISFLYFYLLAVHITIESISCAKMDPFIFVNETYTIIDIILFSVFVWLATYKVKSKKYLTAIASIIVSIVLIVKTVYHIKTAIEEEPYYAEFDQEEWNKSCAKPLPMIRVLVRENSFIGLTKTQLVAKYGEPYYNDLMCDHYHTTDRYRYIKLTFESDTITEVNPYCYYKSRCHCR